MIKSPEDALKYMREHATELAQAKANRIYMDEYRKSLKAILFQKAPQGTISDKENFAYSHDEYLTHLKGLQAAVELEEELKWMMTAAQTKVEIWRSQNANNRMVDNSHR